MQLNLFDNIGTTKEEFAQRICDEFNSLNTVWKNHFYVRESNLETWDHVKLERKVLCICIKARNWRRNKTFVQFEGDRESQRILYNAPYFSKYLADLEKDKDFSICITPWSIYIYFHNWELKKV